MGTFADSVTLLQEESSRIKQYLHTLPPDAWTRPSACTQWQVQDVVAHLVRVAEVYGDFVARGIQGDHSPPPGWPPAGMGSAMAGAGRTAQRSMAARERSSEQVLAAYDAADDQLNRLLAGLSPQDRAKPCYLSGGLVPAQHFIDLRLKELAIHEWDIRSRLEPNAHVSPASLPAIMTTIAGSMASGSIPWAFWPGPRLSTPVRYRFVVTGPVPYRTTLVVAGDRVALEEAGDAAVDVTFQCDTETFVLLISARLTLESALDNGRVIVEGDRSLAMAFSQWFKGV
jgi:uncharacterized protein (TIGR03083 family)